MDDEDFAPIERHNTVNQIAGMQAGLAAGWPVIAEQFSSIIPEVWTEKSSHSLDRFLNTRRHNPRPHLHQSWRFAPGQYFFRDSHVALVDFQAICRSAPEHDLAYFLTQSLSQSLRSKEIGWLNTTWH